MGPPLVFVHGWGFNGTIWDGFAGGLQATFQVVTPDLPGYGRSPVPSGRMDLVVLAEALLGACPARAIWIGWSLGGLVALQAALSHPERVGGLVLIASSPCFVIGNGWPHGIDRAQLDQLKEAVDQDPRTALERFITFIGQLPQGSRAVSPQLRRCVDRFGIPAGSTLLGGLEILERSDLRASLASLAGPLLVVLGGRDVLVPAAIGPFLAERLTVGFRTAIIEGAGHVPFLSHPEQTLRLVKSFLNRHA
ncbi:MAG: pimeloyl-ACP methyl ester esterase BioH [Gammaproteobacteria bacterium]